MAEHIKASIITLTLNGLEYLREIQNTYPNIKLLANGTNVGHAAGCKQAANVAAGEVLVFLNNDTIVPPGWLADLMAPLTGDPKLAATGPTSNGTGELQLDNESFAHIHALPEDVYKYGTAKRSLTKGKVWYFHRLAGFCLVVKKSVFAEVGGMDEKLGLSFYGDDELCFRIRKKGYRLAIVPSVFVYHRVSSTFKALGLNVDLLMGKDKYTFLRKITRTKSESMVNPKVTIITTTYNRPTLLNRALRSIIAQKHQNWEAIVVNDGGEDVSSVVARFHDPRFRYVQSTHVGRPAALNLAVSQASGQYVGYLDDDDIWYPNHLEECVQFLERNPSIGVVFTKVIKRTCRPSSDGTGETLSASVGESIEFDWRRLLAGNWIPDLSFVHRRSLLTQVGPFKELPVLEDWELLLRLTSVSEVAHVPLVTGEIFVDITGQTRNELLRRSNPELYVGIINQIRWAQKPARTSEQLRIDADNYLDSGHVEQGITLLEHALEINPFNCMALYTYVKKRQLGSKVERFLELLNQFLAERPDRSVFWKALAIELMRAEKYADAQGAVEMALWSRENEFEAGELYRLLSNCYSKLGVDDTAIACVAKSLEIEHVEKERLEQASKETRSDPMFTLLRIYWSRKDLQDAFPEAREGNYDRLTHWAVQVIETAVDSDYRYLAPFHAWYQSNPYSRKEDRET